MNDEYTEDTNMGLASLSYDDTIPYEEQASVNIVQDPEPELAGLADRIGSTRLYLLSDNTKPSKRKHEDNDTVLDLEYEEAIDEAGYSYRPNALFLTGSPICFLPTARLFAYATHFDARPLGLEWVDDSSCILVFEDPMSAKLALRRLQKSAGEDKDVEGFVTSKSIPTAVWPPEERINQTLGKGEGLKGIVKMRYARHGDVKKRNARQESNFYKKHGESAGKEMYGDGAHEAKRRKRENEMLNKAQLDADLDSFLAEEDNKGEDPPSPPSKMRSDYIAQDGRTLLDRTSKIRFHGEADTPLLDRLTEPRPQGRLSLGRRRGADTDNHDRRDHVGRRREQESRARKTQQELDEELDAFLNSRE